MASMSASGSESAIALHPLGYREPTMGVPRASVDDLSPPSECKNGQPLSTSAVLRGLIWPAARRDPPTQAACACASPNAADLTFVRVTRMLFNNRRLLCQSRCSVRGSFSFRQSCRFRWASIDTPPTKRRPAAIPKSSSSFPGFFGFSLRGRRKTGRDSAGSSSSFLVFFSSSLRGGAEKRRRGRQIIKFVSGVFFVFPP